MSDETPVLTSKHCIGDITHDRGIELPIANFQRHSKTADGYQQYCRDCLRELQKRSTKNAKTREKKKKQIGDVAKLDVDKLIKELENGQVTIDGDFMLRELLRQYAQPGIKTSEKIKCLELMAKFSPDMVNADKNKSKKEVMASLLESLNEEKEQDGGEG